MARHDDFGTFERFRETPVADMPPAMKEAYDLTKSLRGLVPGPQRIWLANPALAKTIVPTGAYFQNRSTLSKDEIVTNLGTAWWLSAYAAYEHERIGVEQGHLAPEAVQRMQAGLPVAFDEPRQDVVYQVAYALLQPRPVPLGLCRRARDLIAEAGLVDVSVLIGWFTMVSMTLAAFDVPANADAKALDQ